MDGIAGYKNKILKSTCEVRGHSPQACPYFWQQLQGWEFSKTTLELNDSLEECTKSHNNCGYCLLQWKNKGYRLKSAKGRDTWGFRRSKHGAFSCPVTKESWTVSTFLAMICDNTQGIRPAREVHPSLDNQSFYCGDMVDCTQECRPLQR